MPQAIGPSLQTSKANIEAIIPERGISRTYRWSERSEDQYLIADPDSWSTLETDPGTCLP